MALTVSVCDADVSVLNRMPEKGASMFEDDRSYYQHRAEVEIGQVQSAIVPSVIRAHQQPAQAYRGALSETSVKVQAS